MYKNCHCMPVFSIRHALPATRLQELGSTINRYVITLVSMISAVNNQDCLGYLNRLSRVTTFNKIILYQDSFALLSVETLDSFLQLCPVLHNRNKHYLCAS